MTYDEWKTTEPQADVEDRTHCDCGARLIWIGLRWEELDPCTCARDNSCLDCGMVGEVTGHQTCQYPQDHP